MSSIKVYENDRDITITATAGQTVFNSDWPAFEADHIVVEQTPSGGSPSTLILNTDYTLTDVGEEAGFTVTLVTPAALDDELRIYSDIPIDRESNYALSRLPAAVLNQELATMIMIMQEMQRAIDAIVAGAISVGSITNAMIGNDEVQNAKLAEMATLTLKGNDTGGSANPQDLTVAEVVAMLKANDAAIRGATAGSVLTPDGVASSYAWVTLTDAASIALDWSAGFNRTVTLGGNRTLANPTNVVPGSSRFIEVVQDGTGSRTLAFDTNYRFPGAVAPTLSVTAGRKDLLQLYARSSTEIWVFTSNDLRV